jgi:FtsZ-interacting cell division protein YlmF
MDTPDWTLEMVIKYFAMKQASKPRDYNSNRQDVYSKQPDQQSDKPDRQPEKQQDRQHNRQQTKPKYPDCSRSHLGACHTKKTELTMSNVAGKSFFAKRAVESSQHTWHIDSGATYTTIPNKAWFVSYEARKNEYI